MQVNMKIKKEIIILIGIIIVIIIAILINLKINNKQPLSNTPKTLQILLKEYYEKANTVDSSEKLKLLQELKEKTLQELNDTLYYKSFNTYDSILDDIRTIFICNENYTWIFVHYPNKSDYLLLSNKKNTNKDTNNLMINMFFADILLIFICYVLLLHAL